VTKRTGILSADKRRCPQISSENRRVFIRRLRRFSQITGKEKELEYEESLPERSGSFVLQFLFGKSAEICVICG
jgi:hypothetical protein